MAFLYWFLSGYFRFTPHGLQLEKNFFEENAKKMQKGLLTDDNRHEFIDPASLVIKIGVFPPRQKGLIARQSSEIKCLDSTRLTDLFDRIFCPTNSMSLLSGHDFAENPSKFSFELVRWSPIFTSQKCLKELFITCLKCLTNAFLVKNLDQKCTLKSNFII